MVCQASVYISNHIRLAFQFVLRCNQTQFSSLQKYQDNFYTYNIWFECIRQYTHNTEWLNSVEMTNVFVSGKRYAHFVGIYSWIEQHLCPGTFKGNGKKLNKNCLNRCADIPHTPCSVRKLEIDSLCVRFAWISPQVRRCRQTRETPATHSI